MFFILIVLEVTWLYIFGKAYQIVPLKWMYLLYIYIYTYYASIILKMKWWGVIGFIFFNLRPLYSQVLPRVVEKVVLALNCFCAGKWINPRI